MLDRMERNAAQQARVKAARAAMVQRMEAEGWRPQKVRGYSNRYRVTMQKGRMAVVALKVQTGLRGWMGWAQRKGTEWGSPLTDSDHILMATPHQGGLGVWMAPTAAVRDRLELVQQFYDRRNRAPSGALWFNLFDMGPNEDPSRNNFAEGAEPMWVLPFDLSAVEAAEPADDRPGEAQPPAGLAAFSNGQLIDELTRRGLKSFSFG